MIVNRLCHLCASSNFMHKVKCFAYQWEKLIAREFLRKCIDDFAVMRVVCDRAQIK